MKMDTKQMKVLLERYGRLKIRRIAPAGTAGMRRGGNGPLKKRGHSAREERRTQNNE